MKTLRFAMSLAFIAGLAVIHAKAQTAEETLAKIERDFAAAQITKNPKAFEDIASAMSDDFYSFDPTTGVRLTKKELIAALQSPQYVASKMEFPPFFIRIFGSTAVAQGTNYELGSVNGKEFSGTYEWFDVFEKRDGRWVWIVSQSSKVDDKITAKAVCLTGSWCAGTQQGFSLHKP
jgi:regulatory protein YycI of two-component signal transduction system YycFG